jgi:hypothetical protein
MQRLTILSAAQKWESPQEDIELVLALAAEDPSGISCGLGLFSESGALVTSAVLLRLDAETVWVSYVITEETWRRRGLVKRLLQEVLSRTGTDAVGLLGSVYGQPLYRSLGFEPLGTVKLLSRPLSLQQCGPPTESSAPAAIPLTRAELDVLLAGETAPRASAMRAWHAAAPQFAWAVRSANGRAVLAWALGHHWFERAVFIGPLWFGGTMAEPSDTLAVRRVIEAIVAAARDEVRP